MAALAGTAAPAAALGEAERAGILLEQETPSGWRVSFAHLLVRQAVYGDLGPSGGGRCICVPPRSWGARSRSLTGPPLLSARTRNWRPILTRRPPGAAAGKLRLAARYLQQAAAVSRPGPGRDERALSSFELLVRAADVARAEAARPAVEQLPASARRDAALGQLALLAARPLGCADFAAGGMGRS